MDVHLSVLKDRESLNVEEQNAVWSCPLCPPDTVLLPSESAVRNHIAANHEKRLVQHNGWSILKCNLDCGVLRNRSHYHCPSCDKAVISRGDFMFHLKGHDIEQGLKPRGRRKTLATVLNSEAGIPSIQLFSHASLVVSPVIVSLIDDHQSFWSQLQEKTGMTCFRDEGPHSGVVKANNFLENYVLNKLDVEIAEQQQSIDTDKASQSIPSVQEESSPTTQTQTHLESTAAENAPDTDIRKSQRRRKPNPRLNMYVTPKTVKPHLHGSNSAVHANAVRRSTIAHTLKSSVQQDCHVTLTKDLGNNEYQVSLTFPPPTIVEPPSEELPVPEPLPELADVLDDNPLANIDDDDDDEDFKMDDMDAENVVSDDEMDDADQLDKVSNVKVSQSSVTFRCNQCQSEFSSINQLMRHRNKEHKSNLETATASQSHMVASSDDVNTLYQCSECEFTTTFRPALKLHISRMHREKQLECLDCHEKFGPLIDLKMHIKETGHRKGHHTNLFKQIVECKKCGKKLQLKNLKMHIAMVHEKVKPFKCDICGKMFGTRFLVKEHMESHKNMGERVRPYQCHLCGQAFFKKLPLDEHLAKHEGKPQYACDQCPKKFYHQSGWKRHLQHHSDQRPFHCEVCGKSFKTSTNLSAHKMVHKPMAFMCMCGRTYQQKHTLKSHQEKCAVHQEFMATQMTDEELQNTQRYMCGFCQETFTDFEVVQEHVKQHVPESVEIEVGSLEGALAIGQQSQDGDADGGDLTHLTMTAALEHSGEGRTMIVTDIPADQLQQLVAYQSTSIIDQAEQLGDPAAQIMEHATAEIVEPTI